MTKHSNFRPTNGNLVITSQYDVDPPIRRDACLTPELVIPSCIGRTPLVIHTSPFGYRKQSALAMRTHALTMGDKHNDESIERITSSQDGRQVNLSELLQALDALRQGGAASAALSDASYVHSILSAAMNIAAEYDFDDEDSESDEDETETAFAQEENSRQESEREQPL